MNGRERFLAAINNQKPDRMPCQVDVVLFKRVFEM